MKTKLFFCVLLFILTADIHAQVGFNKEFLPWRDTALTVNAWTCDVTADDGYIMGGFTGTAYISPECRPFLIRANALGDTLWTRNYEINSAFNTCLFSVDEDPFGNFITCGSIIDSVTGFQYSVLVMKINSSGNVIWANSYSLSNDTNYLERGQSVKCTADGGYVVAGDVFNNGYDAFILKLDANGNVAWSKVFSGTNSDLFYSVCQTSDGGFVAAWQSKSFDTNGNETCVIVRVDANGDTLWSRNFQTTGTSIGWMVSQTAGGNFIVAASDYGSNTDMCLIEINGAGVVNWAKTYGGSGDDYGYCAAELPSGGFALAGTSRSFNDQIHGNSIIVRVNSTGQVLWAKEYGTSESEEGFGIGRCSNGNFGLFGYSDNWYPTSSVFLCLMDSSGNSGCNDFVVNASQSNLVFQAQAAPFSISSGASNTSRSVTVTAGGTIGNSCVSTNTSETEQNEITFLISPNPCLKSSTLKLSQDIENGQLKVYSLAGALVKVVHPLYKGETVLNLDKLEKGMYFYSLSEKGKSIFSGKLIIAE